MRVKPFILFAPPLKPHGLLLRLAMAPCCQKAHSGRVDDARRLGREIEFLVLFLVVKDHFLRFL